MTTVNYVDAKFGGDQVRFWLSAKNLTLWEDLHGSARHAMTRLLAETWRVKDVLDVLTWAHPGGLQNAQSVERVVSSRPAVYAPLAVTVLVAALSGIKPEDATFDEDAD